MVEATGLGRTERGNAPMRACEIRDVLHFGGTLRERSVRCQVTPA